MNTPVIPRPAKVELRQGTFLAGPRHAHHGRSATTPRPHASPTTSPHACSKARGFAPARRRRCRGHDHLCTVDPKAALASDEAYTLDITPQGAKLTARAPAGLFYGAVTLWQLATADGGQGPATIAAQRIEDAPRFAWRGMMLDVARHFRSTDEVKALLDQMALHKLNTFHWHLTDDQGWRIEIKQYPKLTEVGGCRIPAGAAGRDAKGEPKPYCGFYTQDEIRDVVKYAAERYITVVPEIDLPGHAQAAIAAYPQLGVTGKAPPVSPDWGVHTWLFNVDDGTFTFPRERARRSDGRCSRASTSTWAATKRPRTSGSSPQRVQAKLRELNLKDEMQLQSWFMGRLGQLHRDARTAACSAGTRSSKAARRPMPR